ncbi:MAG TPA: lipid A biosynthesis acyltransferase, partial [Bacteroidia bacterium]|nr:lipid A biosynthesis acyltransferase [Bacteroidia bacterium]
MGRFFFNILALPLIYFISVWPFWLLHAFSTFIFFFVYHVFAYRKQVVFQNLKNSFPEKKEEEIERIAKEFYIHFCDVMMETLKLLTISKETFRKHFSFDESAEKLFDHYESKGQSMIGVMGHCGNWEWGAIAYPTRFKQLITGVYHPLTNKN